ncbi:MAG: plasmid stabilization protein [Rhizobiales bacterium 17-65-6]|nr:MAG: plasmid stabilization protein [Rhizobiales bacterium 17-65-6]
MKLLLSREAETDLERIGDHIAQDSPARARSFVHELLDRAFQLTAAPKAYPLVPRYESLGIRRCVHGNYLIFYRLDGDVLIVLHILNGAMDVETLLFRD